ncbi:MAG: glycosyltransferase [Clostridia bacterium]|nr:glycosyltransferase [Clostridia bacterium]
MKVCVVCDVLGRENNGTTIAAMNLIRSLKSKGHTVNVVCPDEDRRGQEGFYVVPRLHLGPFDSYVAKNGVVLAKADKRIIGEAMEGADAVHVMMAFALGKAAAKMAKQRGIALTAGFHCQAENFTGHIFMRDVPLANRITYKVFYKRLYKRCDMIHYPTQFMRDTFEKVVGKTSGTVISNGVNRRFTPGEGESRQPGHYTVLYTGRYGPEKSHDLLLKGIALSRHVKDIDLILAGAGPKEQEIKKLVKKLGIPMPTMRFFGREEMPDVIRSADLYVHPAEIELESIACLEAIACGVVPLISNSPRSAAGGFALSEKNLFQYDDPSDLAQKLDWWLEHPEEKRACSRQYAGYAERFDFDRCMDEMEKMILSAVEANRHGS